MSGSSPFSAIGTGRELGIQAKLESHLPRPQALAQAIEEAVVEQNLETGTRLGTKEDLRARYGVAITTVNEAMRVLQTRGVVHVKPGPGGGVFVADRSRWLALSQLVLSFKHSAKAVVEVFAVRDSIELLIASEAAAHHRAADLRQMRRRIDEMEKHRDDPLAYLRANWAFHREVAATCPNEFARSLYGGLLDFAESELTDVEGRADFDVTSNLEVHRRLLEAIASRDLERVGPAVEAHNRGSRPIRS